MDSLATQILEDNDCQPTQQISSVNQDKTSTTQIGVLNVGSTRYPVKKGINTIGRHPTCNIILNDHTVSKKHAEIEANSPEATIWILDLHSSNKTKLNNSVLRPGRCYELKDGSVLGFGMIQAIFEVCPLLDDSAIPETPLPSRQKNQLVIPGTPDSSTEMSNASTMGDVSTIPATQANDREPTFRRPSVPQRNSTGSKKKNFPRDSSVDDSLDDRSFTTGDKENVGKPKVSIHDLETQKQFESQNETSIDIHDIETQKIDLSNIKISTGLPQQQVVDIHDMETQNEETEDNANGTSGTNMQYDVDIHDMITPKRFCTQNTDDNTENENLEITTELLKIPVREEMSSSNIEITDDGETEDDAKDKEKNSEEYLQLSPATNFDEDYSVLDKSHDVLGSQNLLDHIIDDDEVMDLAKLESTSVKSTNVDDEQNTDDENIFDAATQVKIHDENDGKDMSQRDAIKISQGTDDSDETNQGVFQSYSYVRSKDSKISSQHEASDDSDTDEEGHFVKIALQERENISCSFEKRRSDVSEMKNSRGSSKDSEDMFNMLTQHVNPANKNASIMENNDDEVFNAPTQVVEKFKTDVKIEDSDLMPTQILSTVESPAKKVPSISLSKRKENAVEDDITEIEDDVATQIITPPEDTSGNDRDRSPSPNENHLKETSIDDIDYETAPTQLISDVERKRSTRKSNVSKKVNFNDSLEKNLNAMFCGENEDSLENQEEISTQVLKNVLQSSQCNDESQNENSKSNLNSKSPTIDKVQNSIESRKSKAASLARKTRQSYNLRDANTDSNSQNMENYFSSLTSARKRNVLADSQDLSDSSEDTSDNKTKNKSADELATVDNTKDNVDESPSRSRSKTPSTPRSLRRNKREESTVVEEIGVPKSIKDTSIDTEESQSSKPNPKNPSIPESTVKNKWQESKVVEVSNPETVTGVSTSSDTEEPQQSSKTYDYEDILDGLPEVRISNAIYNYEETVDDALEVRNSLSNPPSPTLGTPMARRMNTRSKKNPEYAASKKKRVAGKSSRKASVGRKNTENATPYQFISKSDSSSRRGSMQQELPVNVNDVPREIDEEVNKNSKRLTRNSIIGSSQIKKGNDSLRDRKSIPSNSNVQKQTSQSPSVQSSGRTRNSSKKDVDRSSIFQVANEASIENITKPAEPNTNASRTRKRTLSAVEVAESSAIKKLREDADESTRTSTRGRKISAKNSPVNRRYSANILNFATNKNSPIDMKAKENSKLPLDETNLINKQAVINLVRLTSQSPTGSMSPSVPVESVAKDTLTDLTKQTQVDETSKTRNRKPVSKLRQVRSRKANKQEEVAIEDSSSQGEESQEVEKIMSGSMMEQSIKDDADIKKDVETNKKGVNVRNTRKRAQTNTLTDEYESSVSSEDAHFEVPAMKSKRAKISKTISNVKEVAVRKTRNSRQSPRSSQIKPDIISESSSEERLENSDNQNDLNNTVSKSNNAKQKGTKRKAVKLKGNKKQNKLEEKSVSSEMNSSVDDASIVSISNRTRRSTSSISSPFKIKHKILFTGISANDYSKLLTKLGASQVEDPIKCTVLVTDKVRRTVKFLCALAQAVPIVSVDWLIESEKVGHFVDLENYILKDPAAEAKFGFRLRSSWEKAKQDKLLEGYSIVLTPKVAPPPLAELKSTFS
ncbi:mediator of DNA damage checkpoint protein 1 isoform X2 [Osmia bicornis bicornis]|uniref:mediator of DNA damage checkpoint protein 1 isoform X2 n=1 Tax=Osmia bicornis bicornis TaxID=1437191 RepID=UPI001EAEFCFC|nr:mediator of DNA damage checkpoint protein 1 isoform X2 [Osmia bicornis bicornis]